MIYRATILLAALAACSQSAGPTTGADRIARCEQLIMQRIKTPSTYVRIDAREYDKIDFAPNNHVVSIEYDAENAFGAPIRSTQYCRFPNGKEEMVDLSQEMSFVFDAGAERGESHGDAINDVAGFVEIMDNGAGANEMAEYIDNLGSKPAQKTTTLR